VYFVVVNFCEKFCDLAKIRWIVYLPGVRFFSADWRACPGSFQTTLDSSPLPIVPLNCEETWWVFGGVVLLVVPQRNESASNPESATPLDRHRSTRTTHPGETSKTFWTFKHFNIVEEKNSSWNKTNKSLGFLLKCIYSFRNSLQILFPGLEIIRNRRHNSLFQKTLDDCLYINLVHQTVVNLHNLVKFETFPLCSVTSITVHFGQVQVSSQTTSREMPISSKHLKWNGVEHPPHLTWFNIVHSSESPQQNVETSSPPEFWRLQQILQISPTNWTPFFFILWQAGFAHISNPKEDMKLRCTREEVEIYSNLSPHKDSPRTGN